MISFRRATDSDLDNLNQLAYLSEAYWGENAEFLSRFKEAYTIDSRYLLEHHVMLMEENRSLLGFYAIKSVDNLWELDFFYVGVALIGHGYGKIMWDHLIQECIDLGILSFEFVTSPEAEAFYLKMGAARVGMVESSLRAGKMIPKLKVKMGE